MRRALAETLVQIAEQNDRVIFLTGDLGFQMFDEFQTRFGSRYINVGVAEAQLVCAAAGLALTGWRPVIYSIASFMTGRPYEQIRIAINYPGLPVIIIGAGGGYTYASSGVTHHAGDDIGLMSLLPNMTIVAPGDPAEVRQLLPQLFQLPGPAYLRVGTKMEETAITAEPAVLGKARLLQEGERVAIITTGDILPVVVEAAIRLKSSGISPIVYQFHTVKPLDTDSLDGIAKKVRTIIVVEEHVPTGGLFSAISQWRAVKKEAPQLIRLGAPDELILGNPKQNDLRRRIRCDCESIAQICQYEWLK